MRNWPLAVAVLLPTVLRAQTATIVGLNPAAVTAGSGATVLFVTGSGFTSGYNAVTAVCGAVSAKPSVVNFDGVDLATAVSSTSLLVANIPAALLVTPRSAHVTVRNDLTVSCQGGVTGAPSNSISFTIQPNQLQVTPARLSLSAPPGGTSSGEDRVVVAGAGTPTPFTVTTAAGWVGMSLSPGGPFGLALTGTLPGGGSSQGVTVYVRADARGLSAAGSPYASVITIASPGRTPATVEVSLQVQGTTLSLSPDSVTLTMPAGGSGTATVRASAAASVSNPAVPWLTVSPLYAAAGEPILLTASAAGLTAGTYTTSLTVNAAGAAPVPLPVTLQVQVPLPAIASGGVVNGASLLPGIAAGSWVTIRGERFTDATGCDAARSPYPGCRAWTAADFSSGTPTSLDGVQVLMNGRQASVAFVSPTQLNVLPPDLNEGQAEVQVRNGNGTSATVLVAVDRFAPAFFVWGGRYAVATHADGAVVGPRISCPGCYPARKGETITLWGTGFGPTDPAVPAGRKPADVNGGSVAYAANPVVTIGGVRAEVSGAALSPDAFGLYQVVVTVPDRVTAGDQLVVAVAGGRSSPAAGVAITVE